MARSPLIPPRGRKDNQMTTSGPPPGNAPAQPEPEPVGDGEVQISSYGFPAGAWRTLEKHPPPGVSRIR